MLRVLNDEGLIKIDKLTYRDCLQNDYKYDSKRGSYYA